MESARSNCLIHEELADHDKMCTFVLGSFLLFYTYADSMYSLVRRNVPIHSFFFVALILFLGGLACMVWFAVM